ncbi:MAG TPA: tRNA (adenosine(37)-N6)-threonylcarbamoyltransferase complex ATPase subunit type 1 TsaE [Flavobacteriales bacterium]|nr:tRNA (adenosine(37)-N6)-threonylcarbamoyltransferase complex ATPase subunit type 1 TsaE [Flavobacteriales bacterium]
MLATITLRKPEDATDIARLVLSSYREHRVFALKGDLGAGKTTLIKGFCAALGVDDHTSSPSFAIVNEYRTAEGDPLYHFDLYRLRNPNELREIGFEEYVDSGSYCFIEWPELAEDILPENVVVLTLSAAANGWRTIRLRSA